MVDRLPSSARQCECATASRRHHFDLDAELDLWFSGLGKVRLEFKGKANITQLGRMIATFVL
jgi:hypothetical protein